MKIMVERNNYGDNKLNKIECLSECKRFRFCLEIEDNAVSFVISGKAGTQLHFESEHLSKEDTLDLVKALLSTL